MGSATAKVGRKSPIASFLLPAFLLLLQVLPDPTSAATANVCTVHDMDVVVLQKQMQQKPQEEWSIVERLGFNANVDDTSHTATAENNWDKNSTISWNETDVMEYVYARECRCFYPQQPVVYCPLDILTCLQGTPHVPPSCRNSVNVFAGWMQIILVAWLLLLFLCLFRKRGMGANVRDCVISSTCLFPVYREWLADRILRGNSARARELYRSNFMHQQAQHFQRRQWIATVVTNNAAVSSQQEELQQREQVQDDIELTETAGGAGDNGSRGPDTDGNFTPGITSLILRTRTYGHHDEKKRTVQATNGDDKDTDEGCCAICFVDFQNGDRVGLLEVCSHQFHVSCLKPWLQRRNACPLCQKEGIAKSR